MGTALIHTIVYQGELGQILACSLQFTYIYLLLQIHLNKLTLNIYPIYDSQGW